MADSFWKLEKGSTFNTDLKCAKILYHSNLNVVLVITKNGDVLVYDGTSGAELHKSKVSETTKDAFLDGVYVSAHNKLILTNGIAVGMRSDYNGILLFDTILQSTIQKSYDQVEIELPLFEAQLIYQALKQVELPTAESVIDLTNKLEVQIAQNGNNLDRDSKSEKWDTIRLKSTHNSLKWVASTMASELRRQNRYIPALSIASSINERLNCLLPPVFNNTTIDRTLMFSEANRRETFTKWPHMDYKWALPDQMAQAGFYHQPNTIGDDRAMCFTCVVCLVCWEPTDEPWSEHERHAPTCPFVRGEYTQNVPLSVNYATTPALALSDRIYFGTSALSSILPTFSKKGLIILYSISRFMKVITEFHVPCTLGEYPFQSASQSSAFSDIWQQKEAKFCLETSLTKTIAENLMRSNNLFTVTACSILNISTYNKYMFNYETYVEKTGCSFVGDIQPTISNTCIRSCLVVALRKAYHDGISAWNNQSGNDDSTSTIDGDDHPTDYKCQLLLAVYDFHHKEIEDGDVSSANDAANNERSSNQSKASAVKKSGTGTGTAISRNKDCEYYSTKIYEATSTMLEDIGLMETESTSPNHTMSVNNSLQSSASFVFPPLEGVQMTSNNTVNLTEPMDSILSSTNSTGTISPSEEKPRDPKTEGELDDDSSKNDRSKNALPNIESADLDKEVMLVQQFRILDQCSSSLEISGLYPTFDGQHLLVIIKNNEEGRTKQSTMPDDAIGGMLLLYRINFNNSVMCLEESYTAKKLLKTMDDEPKEFVMIPTFLKQDESYWPYGHIPMGVLLTASGELHLINLKNLETVSVLQDKSSKFVSIVYCDLLEKLCACDESGRLHFLSVLDQSFPIDQPFFGKDGWQQSGDKSDQRISHTVSILPADLKTLLRLTYFENVTPCYLANVPAGWNEVKQAQKQRRHPQLLQQVDSELHTRSWKLQIGERTWDEHVFELTLTQSLCIGHVDVKFSLHPSCQLVPNIQVTLLRLKNDGKVCAQSSESTNDEATFSEGSSASTSSDVLSNPVNSKEYHLKHNTEVLCGPVNLVKYLDLSKRSGTITLTSPKLFRSCCRTLLLHVKALGGITQETTGSETKLPADKPVQECKKKTSDQVNKQYSKFYSSLFVPEDPSMKKEQTATVNINKKPSAGCDWIHELSVTIRKPKRVNIAGEKSTRCHMLESLEFVDDLLKAFCMNSDSEYRLIAMDILVWIASIRMCRFRSVDQDISMQQLDFAQIIEFKFSELIKFGFIEGSRKLAHKVTKLLVACSMGCKEVQDLDVVRFDSQLLKVLIDWIPQTLQCWSAGAFRWFFQLLLYVLPQNRNHFTNTSQKCFTLLNQVAKELHSRRNPYHLLLRTRYGLYGNPFESELFDTEPIIPGRSSSVPVTYANLVAGPNIVFNSTPGNESSMNGFFSLLKPMNAKEFTAKGVTQKLISNSISNSKTDLSFLTGISASHYMKGLLEVEPLHFTCHATSDGTRVERVDTDIMDEEAIVNYYGPTSANAPFQTATAFSPYQGGKKTEKVYIFQDISDISQTPLETVMSEEAFQHFKMSVIPKIKQSAKQLEVGKQLIVIDNQIPGPSYVPIPIYHDKVTYSEVNSGFPDNSLSWQQLLVPPPQQVIIIDRMHSGAKRFVVLDFGFPICLTDMLVPSCPELLSFSIDIWTQSEEVDGKRLVVASDIGSKMFIMSDIQPPPICRFLKITAIGRYGMSTTKCRIPIGTFYGHSYVLPTDGYAEENAYFRPHSDVNIQMLWGMMEDVQCRYGLVCSKLRDHLTPFLTSEIPNVDHMNHYLNKGKTKNPTEVESHRVNNLYKDCITFQHQMNVVRNVMNRMSNTYPKAATVTDLNILLASACTDKLRNLTESLLDLLLYIIYELGAQTPPVLCNMLSTEVCQDMFRWLCVGEDSRTQVSTSTLLVRLFGVQPGWGEFLMNTFTQLYSSSYHSVFPQDRVFVLLSYLGRKSILSGGNQNYVIEHILKALLKEFLPLTDTTVQGFIRGKLDLPLLSWLLMFFLQCVEVLPSAKAFSPEEGDSIEKDNDSIRWNFIQSEVPIHRKRMMIDKKGWSRNFRRAIQKKVLQSKQQLKDLEAAKKNFQVTTQALGKLSNHTLKLKQELQNVLKSIPISGVGSSPKLTIKTKSAKEKMTAPNASTSNSSWTDKPSRSSDSVIVPPVTPGKIGVDKAHCLPVIRALIAFMLHVDITCNVDLFLISCKVMSCLLQISSTPVALNEILSEDQLVKLLQMAVWCENGHSMCGGKWTAHAITCLLQDIIDKTPKTRFVVRARRKSSTPLEGGSSASTDFPDMTAMDADATDSFTLFVNNANNISAEENSKDFLLMCSSTPKCDNSQLPSLMESDDSEVDETLEEYLMDERTSIKESNTKSKNNLLPNVSVALDLRLEYGVEENVEVLLRNLADKSSCNLLQSVTAMLATCSTTPNNANQFKMDHPAFLWTPSAGNNVPSTAQMFSSAFDRLFTTFNVMGSNNNLEETVGLWLLLINKNNAEQDSFSNAVPLIPISVNTISNIMTAAFRRSPPSIRLWFLLFKTLTYASNLPPEEKKCNNAASSSCSNISVSNNSTKSTSAVPETIIRHEAFSFLLSNFLSCPFVDDMAGENVVRSFSGMLHRLIDHIRANPAFEDLGMLLKERLLEVLCTLLSNTGAIVCRRGPLDAQIAFLCLLQECDFIDVGFSQATDIVIKLGDLILPYVQHMNSIKCCTSAEIPANAASCFAPPALKSATSAQNADGRRVGPFSRDFLIMQLFRFSIQLLKLSSESSVDKSSEFIIQTSQTDESKAVEQLRSAEGSPLPTKSLLADVVLRHETKMYQFLSSINSCYRSSLNEVTSWHVMPPLKALTNHSTVADGIFHFLNAIFLKSSDYRQKITIFCGYLSNFTHSYMDSDNASMQLSDPMLWLMMRVLNDSNVIQCFMEKGGMDIVCANLRRCFSVILNQHSSTVSSVMQYMYGPHGFNVPTTATKGKKKHTVDRNEDGLINFAPLGTIVLDNPAAQPADVLLMSTTPHRRARSAAWSYHFYPEEKSVDLKILLPCAVLLKEVHLQPHHMSLATSPKAVSLEISRGGGEYIPIQAPVRTSGLAFLHMTLYQPEVVTSVLIRCYKPKEASGIGLSQVRLLGYSAFGDRTWRNTYNDIPNDYQLMNTATSWLRLYHHNLLMSGNTPDIEYQLLGALSSSKDTVACICGLLLLPSPLPIQFNRILAHIIMKLGLHSKELCLEVIKTVLQNGISDNYKCGKPVDSATTNSVFELLHQLCCSTDQYTVDRVTMMLGWLAEVGDVSIESHNMETPIPTYVYCISCILWASQENQVTYDLPALLTDSLFNLLLKWSAGLPVASALKRAVDRVLCSMYVIKPENYISLLENLSIILNVSASNNPSENNVSDDLKEKQHNFIHIKQPFMELSGTMLLVSSKFLTVSEKMFTTLSTISQSHISAQQLIGCGFLALLVDVIMEFCQSNKLKEKYVESFGFSWRVGDATNEIPKRSTPDDRLPMLHIDTISNILQFFSELCWEGSIRTWLGSSEICVFWEELLLFLCKTVPMMHMLRNELPSESIHRNDLPSESLLRLEDAAIKFFSKCCWCYPKNQKTLAHIIYKVIDATPRRYSKYNLGITDFTRRVLLQLVLETEKVFVQVESNLPESADIKANISNSVLFPPPSAYSSSSRHQLLYMNTNHNCVDIINQILGSNEIAESSSSNSKTIEVDEVVDEVLDELCDKITLAAGVTAKDKRLKDALAESLREENIKRMKKAGDKGTAESERNYSAPKLTLWVPTEGKYINVCQELTISQMLQLLADKADTLEAPIIKFLLMEQREEAISDENKSKSLLEEFGYSELPSVLKEFVDTRGLEMVAHRLPMVYPTHYLRMVSSVYDSPMCHDNDQKWVKLDVNDDIYEEVMDDKSANATISMGVHPEKRVFHANENLTVSSVIPPHSLMAFGQFLKLPNYAEWLIRDRKQAQCLLRLVLGGGDEADFNIASDPAKSLILNSLPTLPFEILRYLLKSTPLTSDDGMALRIAALKHGAIHVVLACLAIFTHQPEAIPMSDPNNQHVPLMMALKQSCSSLSSRKPEDKSHQYWAKGTGFGTGSTTQSWNVEQALCRQRFEEEHVTIFLQILACYINPDFKLQDKPLNYLFEELIPMDHDVSRGEQPQLPNLFVELIENSCLLPALASYLRNDSVLDMARHIPLYRAILMLMRVMAVHLQTVTFLLPPEYAVRQTPASSSTEPIVVKDQSISLVELLQKMKTCVDTYSSRLKKNKETEECQDSVSFKADDEDDSGEGLTTLIPDIRATAKIVEGITEKIISKTNALIGRRASQSTMDTASVEEVYLRIMKKLQFDTYDMIVEEGEGLGYMFNVSYHFEPNVHSDGEKHIPARMKRLAQEAVTLTTSLPLSYSSSVFVRCDTDRLDVMKVLITGPAETPYANGCFEFDVYFPPDYPNSPMLINLETTGRHSVRFNPNLYNDGKVCLSVLNTWHGRPEEKWNAQTSSFLQVLVSIQSLILVPEPYFNEPGYERSRGTASGNQSSREYNANIMQATVRWAMLDQIRNPSPCFKDIIHTHFWLKRNEITKQITNWINDIENEVGENSKASRTLSHGTMSLKCHYKMLCEEFAKLTPPAGLEEASKTSQFDYKPPSSPTSSTALPAPLVMLPELVPASSDDDDDEHDQDAEFDMETGMPIFKKIDNSMTELE